MGELKAGVAKVDITPVAPCWMEGYASRRKDGPQSTGVHDRLHARVLVVEGDGGRVAIVSCDLCNLDPQTVDDVRELACEPLELAPERLMVVTTHNHAGPVTEVPHNGAPKTDEGRESARDDGQGHRGRCRFPARRRERAWVPMMRNVFAVEFGRKPLRRQTTERRGCGCSLRTVADGPVEDVLTHAPRADPQEKPDGRHVHLAVCSHSPC